MSERQTCLMLLWHMHQPFYKDLVEGVYAMPWVRLHAMKDYYGMVAMLKDFPEFHATFNLVPSLVSQLQEYARDEAREQAFDLAFRPANELTSIERERLVELSLQMNVRNLVERFPRLRELYHRINLGNLRESVRFWSDHDLRDLQVLSQLAWFDGIYLSSDETVRSLVRKGHGFSEGDKVLVRRKELEIIKVILEEYRSAAERGQIEISTSAFFHPILPLLCDTQIAAESRPGVRLPAFRYRHPEDAVGQIRAAIRLHEDVFGRRPKGLWPSEGGVSDEVLTLAVREGFKWTATDEGILSRSLQLPFNRRADGTLEEARELYKPYRFNAGGEHISVFFRDHYLSDLIGFVYSNMQPEAAAHDLHQRIRAAARNAGDTPKVIPIILDGENAWEFFPGNGREFLKSFYARVVADPSLKAVTASEALDICGEGSLTHIAPGSWINSNFDVWIGSEEDNRAWELLAGARDFFERDKNREIRRPANREDESPPDNLAVPIKRVGQRAVNYAPTGLIDATIDGRETNYFEWIGSMLYLPDAGSGSMHGVCNYLDALYYGCGRSAVYLRLDFAPAFTRENLSFEVRIAIEGDCNARIHASASEGKIGTIEFWKDD